LEAAANSAAFSPDGSRIVSTSVGEEATRVWDTGTGRELFALEAAANSAAFSPDGSRILTASVTNVLVWNATTGKLITNLKKAGHYGATDAAFSPDGSRIVTASERENEAWVWDAATGRQLAVLQGHTDGVINVSFSPDGSRIVTTSADKTARIWDAATGRQLTVLKGHEGIVMSAAFGPDGSRVITASEDKTARIWDVDAGQEVAILKADRVLNDASFSPDGTRVVIASNDGTVRVWKVARNTNDLIQDAKARVPRCMAAKQREALSLSKQIPNWCYEMSKWPLKPRRFGFSLNEKSIAGSNGDTDPRKEIRISFVVPGLPASAAGLLADDVIVSVEGKPVTDIKSVNDELAQVPASGEAHVKLLRDGKQLELAMKPRF
jgi:WD40 repeat protein